MATEITMPQLSDTMDEGTILSWHKSEGDRIERGDALAEVATDKADLEIESFHEGVLLKIHSPVGTTVKVGSVIAVIGEAGESASVASAPQAAPAPGPQAAPAPGLQAAPAPGPQATFVNGDDRVKISPLAKNLAASHGVDYGTIQGSGEGGRIVKRDIESALGKSFSPQEVASSVSGTGGGQAIASGAEISAVVTPQIPSTPQPQVAPQKPVQVSVQAGIEPLSKMRATIASRMVQSMTEIPHFYVSAKLELDALVKMRNTLKSHPQYEGITFNHAMIKAVGLALRAFPRINANYQDGNLVQPSGVNVGIITALPDGLLIPVVKSADVLPLADVVAEANALVQRARSGRPKPDDLVGGTFCISNIGRSKVEDFTAIINPGQGAILAVAGMQEEPVVRDGAIVVGTTMRVTLSVDHRIIDGVVAGEFVTELKRLIEDPVLLLA